MSDHNKKYDQQLHMIIGCGRLGAGVASLFSSKGMDVVIIDVAKSTFGRLPPSYTGFTIEADACDIRVLENAGIKEAGTILVATRDDNINIMIAQMAKMIYEVPMVVMRLYDTAKEALLQDSGIKVIYPIKLEIEAFRDIVGLDD